MEKLLKVVVQLYIIAIVIADIPVYKVFNGSLGKANIVPVTYGKISIIYYDYSFLEQRNNETTLRTRIESTNIPRDASVLIIIKNNNDVMNTITLINPNGQSEIVAERTLCPIYNTKKFELTIEISTNYTDQLTVSVFTFVVDDFVVKAGANPKNLSIGENSPLFLLFKMDSDAYNSIIKTNSEDESCMMFSIHTIQCPIQDKCLVANDNNTVYYQAVTKKGAITILKDKVPDNRMFIVFALDPLNINCHSSDNNISKSTQFKMKNFNLTIENVTTGYLWPIFGAFGFFLSFYLVTVIVSVFYGFLCYPSQNLATVDVEELQESIQRPSQGITTERVGMRELLNSIPGPSYGSITERADMYTLRSSKTAVVSQEINEFCSLESYDVLPEIFTNPNVYRLNKDIKLPFMSKKPAEVLNVKYFLYLWYSIIISVFYALPAIQLVINYQETLYNTGNLDLCFYNFRCARPLSIFTAFNNIVSNIGYVLLGILFILITKRRERLYNETRCRRINTNHNHGVPQFHGVYYAMGLSLTMEGIMSASYHVCPSLRNFQFDTAYMYILSALIIVKIYQTRHPDINPTAHSFFMTMAFLIFLGVLGIVSEDWVLYFQVMFTIIYIIGCILLSCQVYYMGHWNLNLGLFIRIYHLILNDRWKVFIPIHKTRMIMLGIQNAANFAMVIYGATERPYHFQALFLRLLMMNVLLYFFLYIIMKIFRGERFTKISIFYVIIATIFWGCALYCFIHAPTQWEDSPAVSRNQNQNCRLLKFYDIHDIWHFLSAMAMFFSFMGVQNLDDGLFCTERDKIHVF